ncbi:MAG: hypothetical protein AAFS10_21775 [Myxococcota bacterium]
MKTSAQPTEQELQALGLLVPTYMDLRRNGRHILMTLNSPESRPPQPLVTYKIAPKRDFEGTLLANVVEQFAGVLTTQLRAWRDRPPSVGELVSGLSNATLDLNTRVIPSGELKVTVADIHTTTPSDWL